MATRRLFLKNPSTASEGSDISEDDIDIEYDGEIEYLNSLVYVKGVDGSYGGWKTELLAEEITSKVEAKFLLCSNCRGVLRDACLFEEDGKQELRCSVCIQTGVNRQIVQLNRETVNEKKVVCPLRSQGCNWSNELSELLHHLEECGLFLIPCPLKCKDDRGEVNRVERREIETHKESCPLRTNKCDYCDAVVKSCEMNQHLEICHCFPVQCPNMCSEESVHQRGNISIHLIRNCPLQEIQCPYFQYGCEVDVLRRDLDQHEKEFIYKHMKLSINVIGDMQTKIKTLECENKELNNKISELIPKGKLEWKITGVKKKIQKNDATYSEPFYVGFYKLQASIQWNKNDNNHVGIFICINKEQWDHTLKWPFRYKFKFELINQYDSEDNFQKKGEINTNCLEKFLHCFLQPGAETNPGYGFPKLISHEDILDEEYCSNNSIILRISVEQLLDSY